MRLHAFEIFKRPPHMRIGAHVAQFERLNNRAKAYNMVLQGAILLYKFRNNASASDSNEKH